MLYTVASFYHFVEFLHYREFRVGLRELCLRHALCGSILLADEGINGTIAGRDSDVRAVLDFILAQELFADCEYKLSYADRRPFLRMKVRLKSEIIRMGVSSADPLKHSGELVSVSDWNGLLNREDVVVLDVRNDYEIAIGRFSGAMAVDSSHFSEFPGFVKSRRHIFEDKKVAMYCTGGIRCEKASAYMLSLGFGEVYQLHGGILRYLEQISPEQSLWQGDCFVFDRRVALGHGLRVSDYDMCRACGRALAWAEQDFREDKDSGRFEAGVSCDDCYDETTTQQKQRFRERERQIRLAAARKSCHLGAGC